MLTKDNQFQKKASAVYSLYLDGKTAENGLNCYIADIYTDQPAKMK